MRPRRATTLHLLCFRTVCQGILAAVLEYRIVDFQVRRTISRGLSCARDSHRDIAGTGDEVALGDGCGEAGCQARDESRNSRRVGLAMKARRQTERHARQYFGRARQYS